MLFSHVIFNISVEVKNHPYVNVHIFLL
uniref:Uncharacterized protein n=1 Tax=Anguilla anguilla TaxID=7936 RepID=A0A0E9PX61_ANGAN